MKEDKDGVWEAVPLVARGGRCRVEAKRDREVLAWVERFRFVTAEVLAERFGLSPQRVNVRVRRLEDAGLVMRLQTDWLQARAIATTARGAQALGHRGRRAPRPDAQRRHELAIAAFVAAHERESPEVRALTEREQRREEAAGVARYSVDLRPGGRGERRRWPDVVLEHSDGRKVAVEIELSAKAPERLKRILAGYRTCRTYDEVRYLVDDPALARRIQALAAAARPSELARLLDVPATPVTVRPHRPAG